MRGRADVAVWTTGCRSRSQVRRWVHVSGPSVYAGTHVRNQTHRHRAVRLNSSCSYKLCYPRGSGGAVALDARPPALHPHHVPESHAPLRPHLVGPRQPVGDTLASASLTEVLLSSLRDVGTLPGPCTSGRTPDSTSGDSRPELPPRTPPATPVR